MEQVTFSKKNLQMDVFGVDYSKKAIEVCRSQLNNEDINANLSVKDSKKLDFPDVTFDVILDRAAIQHNTLQDSYKIVGQIFRA